MAATPVRILILGKSGVGKSSLANTIFGETVFTVDHTANAATPGCRSAVKNINGTNFKIIDSVGFFDGQRSEDQMRSEMARCFMESLPGPHAVLILLKKENYTTQEKNIIAKIQETFTDEVFNHAVLVFTHGDDLQPNETIKDFVRTNPDLRALYKKCGRRCFVVDNKYWNNNPNHPYRNNQVQVTQLLNRVKHMARRNQHYTNPALEEAARRRQELVNSGIPWEKATEIIVNFLKTATGITTGILVGALLGVPAMVLIVINSLTKMRTDSAGVTIQAASAVVPVVVPVRTLVRGAVVAGAGYGAYRGYQEGQRADSIYEAGANTASALIDETKEQFNTLADTMRRLHRS